MLIGSHFIPKDIELGTYSNVFSDLVNVFNAFVVDDDLQVFGIIRADNSSQNVDQGCFSCTVMA